MPSCHSVHLAGGASVPDWHQLAIQDRRGLNQHAEQKTEGGAVEFELELCRFFLFSFCSQQSHSAGFCYFSLGRTMVQLDTVKQPQQGAADSGQCGWVSCLLMSFYV